MDWVFFVMPSRLGAHLYLPIDSQSIDWVAAIRYEAVKSAKAEVFVQNDLITVVGGGGVIISNP